MSDRITTYEDAFKLLEMEYSDEIKDFIKKLESEGYTEKGIAFSIWKKQEKLKLYRRDERFFAVLRNEVKKYCWKKGDPRWDEYNKRKQEAEKLKEYKNELNAYKLDKMIHSTTEKEATKGKPKGYVYFVQGCCGGAIKIGYSKDPESRLKALQTGYPDTLRILALVPGTEKTEKYYQRKFELYRLNGEWYRPEQEILDKIKEIKTKQA